LEEIWFYDERNWGIALLDANIPELWSKWRYVAPDRVPQGGTHGQWLIPIQPHRMDRCPVVENKRETSDGEYRGALDGMIPGLKQAHNLMARILKDVDLRLFAPKLFQNVENPEDWGPDAYLFAADENAQASVTIIQDPSNFEGIGLTEMQLDGSRRSGTIRT